MLVVLGFYLKRLGWLTEAFNQGASRLVFRVALPALIGMNIVSTGTGFVIDWSIILFGALATLVGFVILTVLSRWLAATIDERGVFVQGAFRGNMGIIGLALCLSTFGPSSAALASVYLGFLSLLYNVLGVLALTRSASMHSSKPVWLATVENLVTNPLIIAIVLAGLWRSSNLPVPAVILESAQYLAQITLPLALLCIGANLSWREFKSVGGVTAWASVFKLTIIPYVSTLIAFWVGYRGIELGVFYLMMSAPTAPASYMVARAMGGNAQLAASIVAVTTVLSLVTTTLGLVSMRAWQWI